MDRPATYQPAAMAAPLSSADVFRIESNSPSVASSAKPKKGFFGRSSKDSSTPKPPKPVKERKVPIPYQMPAQVPHFIYGNGKQPKLRNPSRAATPLSPTASTKSGAFSVKSAGALSEAKDHISELPSRQQAPTPLRASTESETRALKNVRRQSLPMQPSYSSPLMPELMTSKPSPARRPSDGSMPKFSSPVAKDSPASRAESSMGHNTYDLSFPDDSRRRRVSAESLTSSSGASFISNRTADSSMWSQPSATSSSTSLVPTIHASSILDLKDMSINEDIVPEFPRECQLAFDSATLNLSKILGLSLCYLVALDISRLPILPPVKILSATGLTNPPPSFDPKLHFEALRAPERGLLYQRNRVSALKHGHQSGMLVPVIEFRHVGYILCGFTDKPEREFNDRDVKYLRRFATELENWVTKGGR